MKMIYAAKGGEFCVLLDHPENDELTVVADFVERTNDGRWQRTHFGHVRRRDLSETDFTWDDP